MRNRALLRSYRSFIVTYGTLTVKFEQVPILYWTSFLIVANKKLGLEQGKIGEFYPDLVHNEPVIYRAILFAQKAQVSVGTESRKGISCNPRTDRGNEAPYSLAVLTH